MKNGEQDDINKIIKKPLNSVKSNDKPPIILSSKDLDMIIDYTYYTVKMNIDIKRLKNNYYQSQIIPKSLKKSQISTQSEETQKNLAELLKKGSNDINISDNDLDNYIKQAEKYILTINRKTIDSLEKEQQLNINELLTQLPSISKKNTLTDENILLAHLEANKNILPFDFINNYEIDNYTNNTNLLKKEKYFILSDHRSSQII